MKVEKVGWQCGACGFVVEGIDDPGKCEKCGASVWIFVTLKEVKDG